MRHLARFPLVSAIMQPSLEVLWWSTCHACGQPVRRVVRRAFSLRTIASLDYCPCG
ncbi:hypothetical protein PGB90_007037 [Kerria lacca]